MRRWLGRAGEQTLTDALDNPDGYALYRRQYARAEAEEQQRRAAQREAERRCASAAGAPMRLVKVIGWQCGCHE